MLGHTPFDLVNLLICEWEDWITDGFKGKRRIPYAHVIYYLLAKTIGFLEQEMVLRELKSMFPEYKPPDLTDRHRGGRTMRLLHDLVLQEVEAHSGF